jgi:hypothetical protein
MIGRPAGRWEETRAMAAGPGAHRSVQGPAQGALRRVPTRRYAAYQRGERRGPPPERDPPSPGALATFTVSFRPSKDWSFSFAIAS